LNLEFAICNWGSGAVITSAQGFVWVSGIRFKGRVVLRNYWMQNAMHVLGFWIGNDRKFEHVGPKCRE
jgi:hypothetical protein